MIPALPRALDPRHGPRAGARIPPLSVALSVYNGAPYLAGAIESICAQTFADFEFLILDDGSTDASGAIARGYAARDSRIRVIARENRGLVASLNQLLAEARAPWIARMDADDVCLPERFARQMEFLRAHPDHGVIGSDAWHFGADGEPIADHSGLTRPLTHAAICANFEAGRTMLHNAVIYRRADVLKVGGYHTPFAHAEDYDLWLRLSQVTKLANLPEQLVGYRLYPGSVSNRHQIAQTRNAALAWLAYLAREAGRPDPSAGLSVLPADEAGLDACFGPGTAAFVHRRVVERSLYAPTALAHAGWSMLMAHAGASSGDPGLWRLAGRMARAGLPLKAGQLGLKLALG